MIVPRITFSLFCFQRFVRNRIILVRMGFVACMLLFLCLSELVRCEAMATSERSPTPREVPHGYSVFFPAIQSCDLVGSRMRNS